MSPQEKKIKVGLLTGMFVNGKPFAVGDVVELDESDAKSFSYFGRSVLMSDPRAKETLRAAVEAVRKTEADRAAARAIPDDPEALHQFTLRRMVTGDWPPR